MHAALVILSAAKNLHDTEKILRCDQNDWPQDFRHNHPETRMALEPTQKYNEKGRSKAREKSMTSLSIQEAQANLPDLVHGLTLGDEVVIVENDRAVARIVSAVEHPKRPPRRPGTLRGTVLYMAQDFDAPLEDFKEYME